MTSAWRGAARMIAGAFGAFTNGLTSSMPAGATTGNTGKDKKTEKTEAKAEPKA